MCRCTHIIVHLYRHYLDAGRTAHYNIYPDGATATGGGIGVGGSRRLWRLEAARGGEGTAAATTRVATRRPRRRRRGGRGERGGRRKGEGGSRRRRAGAGGISARRGRRRRHRRRVVVISGGGCRAECGNVWQAQLANASMEQPQTKVGGIGVAMRTYGRLINKSAAFFRAPLPAESYLRRKAPCPPQAPKKCSISPASRFSIRN